MKKSILRAVLRSIRHLDLSYIKPHIRLAYWKSLYWYLRKMNHSSFSVVSTLAEVKNNMMNDGGIPLNSVQLDPDVVISNISDPKHRRVEDNRFPGLALDDALVYKDEYKMFSFLQLAQAIKNVAMLHGCEQNFSVLELGCGSGHMLPFFRSIGIVNYLGVDANSLGYMNNPYVARYLDQFRSLNLNLEINFHYKYDVICSFEVLEHLDESTIDNFCRSIHNHLNEKGIFIGTASLQDDLDVHITVKERPFWLEVFDRNGLHPTIHEKEYITMLSRAAPFNWNESNSNIFCIQMKK